MRDSAASLNDFTSPSYKWFMILEWQNYVPPKKKACLNENFNGILTNQSYNVRTVIMRCHRHGLSPLWPSLMHFTNYQTSIICMLTMTDINYAPQKQLVEFLIHSCYHRSPLLTPSCKLQPRISKFCWNLQLRSAAQRERRNTDTQNTGLLDFPAKNCDWMLCHRRRAVPQVFALQRGEITFIWYALLPGIRQMPVHLRASYVGSRPTKLPRIALESQKFQDSYTYV